MEAEGVFVVGAYVFQAIPVLVADAVVDCFEIDLRQVFLEGVGGG